MSLIGIHLFSVIILKMKTYRHHKVAFIIIVLSINGYYMVSISGTLDNWFTLNISSIITYILYILWTFSTSLKYVIQKYLIQKEFCNLYYTQLMVGIGFFFSNITNFIHK